MNKSDLTLNELDKPLNDLAFDSEQSFDSLRANYKFNYLEGKEMSFLIYNNDLSKNAFAKKVIGTPYYLSPELCDEKPYNDKSDVWALGYILYELSIYRHPFNAKCQASFVLKILQSQPVPIHKYYSENLQQLINLLLDKNYLTRPSIYEIYHLLLKNLKNLNYMKK